MILYNKYLLTVLIYLQIGHFGNGVLSYFVFLKSLIALNLVIFVLVFGFIVVPQIVINNGELVEDVTHNIITTLDTNFTCPSENRDFYKDRSLANNILDFFTGEVEFFFSNDIILNCFTVVIFLLNNISVQRSTSVFVLLYSKL